MERKKLEQIVVILLLFVFLLSLVYIRSKRAGSRKREYKLEALEKRFPEDKDINDIPEPASIPHIRYKGSRKDPLRDLLQLYLYILEKDRPKSKEHAPLPELNIEGLIWNSDMPQAIINGSVVGVGDMISGVKLIKISREGITIEYEGEIVFVSKK